FPDVGRARVPTIASRVDLPEPFGPSTIDTRPASNFALTPTSARTGPKVFVTLFSSTLAVDAPDPALDTTAFCHGDDVRRQAHRAEPSRRIARPEGLDS